MNESGMPMCGQVMEKLWPYIDGELPATQAGEVHEHLEACRACFPQFDFQRAFCAFLRTQSRETVPPELRRRIFLQLLAESEKACEE
jgi:anti-sigma factor (TIGR02949 family)